MHVTAQFAPGAHVSSQSLVFEHCMAHVPFAHVKLHLCPPVQVQCAPHSPVVAPGGADASAAASGMAGSGVTELCEASGAPDEPTAAASLPIPQSYEQPAPWTPPTKAMSSKLDNRRRST
jgi:hypothetical protein